MDIFNLLCKYNQKLIAIKQPTVELIGSNYFPRKIMANPIKNYLTISKKWLNKN
jgi:hypothetical protein